MSTIYVGTYTEKDSKGIYAFDLDVSTGKLTELGLAAETTNPSFLALHPERRVLYAVGERSGPDGSTVSAFGMTDGMYELNALGSRTTGGGGACHVATDRAGTVAFAANYGGGSFAAFPINDDGSLGERSTFVQHEGSGPDPKRQERPHCHSVNVTPDDELLLVADLGIDRVMAYAIDHEAATVTLAEASCITTAPGAGPRHLAFHPNGRIMFLINELNATMSSYMYDTATGAFDEVTTLPTLPGDFEDDNLTADIHVSPDGLFVYGTNRGHNSVAVFGIDPESGMMAYEDRVPCGGDHPRNFAIVAGGAYVLVANQNANNIVTFAREAGNGRIKPTGAVVEVSMPVCVVEG
jgi:6-phosphogluconolactonase